MSQKIATRDAYGDALVGLGKERDFRDREFRSAVRAAVKLLNETGVKQMVQKMELEAIADRKLPMKQQRMRDLEEALALSDVIYLLSQGPRARISGRYEVPLPRPRDWDSAPFRQIVDQVTYTKRDLLNIASLTASLNVDGHRADLVILKTARAQAAFDGRTTINERDIALAAEQAVAVGGGDMWWGITFAILGAFLGDFYGQLWQILSKCCTFRTMPLRTSRKGLLKKFTRV